MPQYSFLPFLQPFPTGTRILTGLLITLTLLNVLINSLSVARHSAVEHLEHAAEGVGLGKAANTLGRLSGLAGKAGAQGGYTPYLVCVQGEAVPWFVWTFLTAGFVEVKVVEFLISLVSIPLLSRYLERVWGTAELLKFSAIVIVASNIIGFGLTWIMWFVLGQDEILYAEPIRGTTALITAYLVAFTQLIPEHQVQLLGRFRLRVKHTPGLVLLASNVLTVVHTFFPWVLIQFGFIVGWWYLRFFQPHGDGDFRGDRSETFAFIYWFPPPVRPYIGKVGNLVFNLAVRFRVVQAWDNSPGAYAMLPGPGSGVGGAGGASGSGGAATRAEAERRRALALKALDARVTSSPVIGSTPAGSSGSGETGVVAGASGSGSGATGGAETAGVEAGGKDEVGKV